MRGNHRAAVIGLRQQAGFTLVEIMIAIVISLFLAAGIIQMYLANRQSYRFNDALARIQENGRFALESMAKSLRMADFRGCTQHSQIANRLLDPSQAIGISGEEESTESPHDRVTFTIATNTLLNILTQDEDHFADDPLVVDGASNQIEGDVLSVGDIVLVSDCTRGDIFEITAIDGQDEESYIYHEETNSDGVQVNSTATFSHTYTDSANLYLYRTIQYYLGEGTSDEFALSQRENDGAERDLVEGAMDMQILYGEDSDGDGAANRYVSADSVANMDAVVSVRVALLLRSIETNLTDESQVFRFDGSDVTCPDRRICQVMSSTITLRNRAR
jgi:type IV pilus assembly protein PilW